MARCTARASSQWPTAASTKAASKTIITIHIHRPAGEFHAGEITGRGYRRWADGKSYSGNFVNGEMHGGGMMIHPDGAKYDGHWEHNRKEGESSEETTADGFRYLGAFMAHERHGPGKLYRPGGAVLECYFLHGLPSGDGKLALPDAATIKGTWQAGVLLTGRYESPHSETSYDGAFAHERPATITRSFVVGRVFRSTPSQASTAVDVAAIQAPTNGTLRVHLHALDDEGREFDGESGRLLTMTARPAHSKDLMGFRDKAGAVATELTTRFAYGQAAVTFDVPWLPGAYQLAFCESTARRHDFSAVLMPHRAPLTSTHNTPRSRSSLRSPMSDWRVMSIKTIHGRPRRLLEPVQILVVIGKQRILGHLCKMNAPHSIMRAQTGALAGGSAAGSGSGSGSAAATGAGALFLLGDGRKSSSSSSPNMNGAGAAFCAASVAALARPITAAALTSGSSSTSSSGSTAALGAMSNGFTSFASSSSSRKLSGSCTWLNKRKAHAIAEPQPARAASQLPEQPR